MKIFVLTTIAVLIGGARCETPIENTNQQINVCPDAIRYNVTFFKEHFGMHFNPKLGIFVKEEYVSEEQTRDLPPMFPSNTSRPFASHYYMLMGQYQRHWFMRYPSDQIWHWYQGATAKLYVIDPKTGVMEKRVLNARKVVTVVEAGCWMAIGVRAIGGDSYVLLGNTMVPGIIEEDREIAKHGQIPVDMMEEKAIQNKIKYYTKPPY